MHETVFAASRHAELALDDFDEAHQALGSVVALHTPCTRMGRARRGRAGRRAAARGAALCLRSGAAHQIEDLFLRAEGERRDDAVHHVVDVREVALQLRAEERASKAATPAQQ